MRADAALRSAPRGSACTGRLLIAASRGGIGRFQLEAAIRSAHAQPAITGAIDWEVVAVLYEGLVRLAPAMGALVGRAAAVAEARAAAAGWALLEAIPADAVASYQPYRALAAHLLARLRRPAEAVAARDRAVGLCGDPALRRFLLRQASHVFCSAGALDARPRRIGHGVPLQSLQRDQGRPHAA